MSGRQPEITILGEGCGAGTYLLLVRLHSPLSLSFGRFLGGRPIALPAGEYLYLGSALGAAKSGSPLARRMLRHASRSGRKPQHPLRRLMVREFRRIGLLEGPVGPAPEKRLRWHVDHLLDRREAEIVHAVAIRSPLRLEDPLSLILNTHPGAEAVAPRLGAMDAKSGAHLLRLHDAPAVLDGMLEAARRLMAEEGAGD